jgi:signal transduction histidine kinase
MPDRNREQRHPGSPNGQKEDALRDLTTRLINAQDEERSRIARELHDDLSQRMAILSIRLAQIEPMIEGRSDIRKRLHVVLEDAQAIAADIRRLSHRLHPSMLDHLGLNLAVRGLCQEITATGKLTVEFHAQGAFLNLTKDVTLCVFRIAQESLRNCTKYSGAKSVRVTLLNTGKVVRLSVSDDGRGFEIKPETMKLGLGFTSIRERLQIVGGTMTIRSQRDQGTSVEVSIPLNGECFDRRD